MSQSTLSRELALRIGLAARALPDTDLKQLIPALAKAMGLPITEEKLAALTLQQYQQVLSADYAANSLQQSLHLLQHGENFSNESNALTRIQLYRRGDMPNSIRIAIASEDGIHINGHFSVCKQFYIYQVAANEQRLIAIRAASTPHTLTGDRKHYYRAEILQDCQVLYSQSIGGPAAAKVINQGVHPVKLSGNAIIADIIEQLQHVLSHSPPPWLAKTMGIKRHPATPY